MSKKESTKDVHAGQAPEVQGEPVLDEQQSELAEDVVIEEDVVGQLEEQLKEMNNRHLRLQAEFDNYRKRTVKEKIDMQKYASARILEDVLSVVDDFDRAVVAMEADENEGVREGVVLIYNKLKDFLQRNGLKEIETQGAPFDVDLHEAITKIPAPEEVLKGKVVDCVQKGYMLNDRVLRFAKVVVGE